MPGSSTDTLFKFLLLRPGAVAESPKVETDTPFTRELVDLIKKQGSQHPSVRESATRFTESKSFLKDLSDAPLGSELASAQQASERLHLPVAL